MVGLQLPWWTCSPELPRGVQGPPAAQGLRAPEGLGLAPPPNPVRFSRNLFMQLELNSL